MVLDKLPVPGRPTNLVYSRSRAYCTCSRCRWGGLDIFSFRALTTLFGNGAGAFRIGKNSVVLTEIGKKYNVL